MGIRFGKHLKSVEENVVFGAVDRKSREDHENPPEESRRLPTPFNNELDVVSVAGKRKETEDHENSQEKRRRISIPGDNVDVVSVAGKRKASEDHENSQEKRRRISIPGVDVDVVSVAGKRKETEDHENSQEKRRRISIPGVDVDVVSVAGKRKETEDHENSQEKRRRISIPGVDELPSTSGVPESRNTPEAVVDQRSADDGPVQTTQRSLDLFAKFEAKYKQQKVLGTGGFGFVFAGYRKADNLDVAIKHIPRDKEILLHGDSTGKQIPMEVAVMLKLAAVSERHSAPVDLLDWYDLDQEVILVLERPMPAVDLFDYITAKGACLKEKEAKIIMRQLVDAAIDLQQKHIFHQDIKVENLLIQTGIQGMRVRLIDFGASCFAEAGDAYTDFIGSHIPPEIFTQGEYKAGTSTVFQLGVVLYDLLNSVSFRWDLFYLGDQRIKRRLSKNCRDFLKSCLNKDPDQRLTLEQLRNHLWLR